MTTFISSIPKMKTSHVGADDATSCSDFIITSPEEFHLLLGSWNSLLVLQEMWITKETNGPFGLRGKEGEESRVE